MQLTPREFAALEKLMEWDIASAFEPHRIPPKLPAAIAKQLIDKGLAQDILCTLSGFPPVKIKCHAFTDYGQMMFCMACSEEEPPCPSEG